jgi:hypothetical protein
MNPLFKSVLSLFVFSILFFSCDREEESIPSYLHIKKFTLTANPSVTGLGTYEITSAKVFVNGFEIGNFELPVTIPVLVEGTAHIELFPNVKENGMSSNQKYYKPYNGFKDTLLLNKGKIDTIQPKTSYRENTHFQWIEDFENQSTSLVQSGKDNTDDTLLIIPTNTVGVDQPFSGSQYCGFVKLGTNTEDKVFERSSLLFYDVPPVGSDYYLEMDIKANQQMQVGIYIDNGTQFIQTPILISNSTNGEWKKIYINLKSETADQPAGTKVSVFFGLYKSADTTEDQVLYIDNIKLLHL